MVNPNFFGVLRRTIELILSPLQPLTQLVQGFNQLQVNYNSLTGDQSFGGGGFNNNSSFNNNFGQVGGQ